MAYTKQTWVDRAVQYVRRFTKVDDGTYLTLTPAPGTITAAGTPIDASRLNYMESGIEAAHDAVALKASTTLYTATIPSASWTGSAAPYSKAVTVTGLLSTDTPIIDLVMSGTYATDKIRETNWGRIYRAVTSANTITFYAHSVPSADIPISVKVVR